jgi:glycerophosphoryl diester phosphodiesterase
MLKKIVIFFLIIISMCVLFLYKISYSSSSKKINFDKLNFIAHAGGGYKDISYSNSMESVLKSIDAGFKLIELDIFLTDDNYLVAVHDWKNFKKNCLNYQNYINDKPLSYEKFNNCDYHKNSINLTQLNEDQIKKIFLSDKSLYLVTDKIRDYKILSKKFSFVERILPETFSIKDYIFAKYYGFKNPIFPFKKYNFFIGKILNIKLINISYADFIKYEKQVYKLFNKGINIYVYTSNDENFIRKNINKKISGVYTDFWDVNLNKCLSKSRCLSY